MSLLRSRHVRVGSVTLFSLVTLALLVIVNVDASAANVEAAPFQATQAPEVQAAIDALFTQTAVAEQQLAATQTAQAAFDQSLTATAAFEGTVQAGFREQLRATQRAEQGLDLISAANAAQLRQVEQLPLFGDWLEISPDSRYMAGITPTRIQVYDRELRTNASLNMDVGSYPSVAFSSDGTYLAAAAITGELVVWNLTQPEAIPGNVPLTYAIEAADIMNLTVHDVVFTRSPDTLRLLVYSSIEDRYMTMFYDIPAETPSEPQSIGDNFGDFQRLRARLFTDDLIMMVRDSGDGSTEKLTIEVSPDISYELPKDAVLLGHGFSPQGTWLASFGDNGVNLITIGTGEQQTFDIDGMVVSVRFDNAESLIAVAIRNLRAAENDPSRLARVEIIDIATGVRVFESAEFDRLSSFAFSPDNSYFVMSGDGRTEVWAVPSQNGMAMLAPTITAIAATGEAQQSTLMAAFTPTITPTATATLTPTQTPLPTATSMPLPTMQTGALTLGTVSVSNTRLRDQPSSSGQVVVELAQGDKVGIFGQTANGGYVFVETADGVRGWVAKQTIALDDPTMSLPILSE